MLHRGRLQARLSRAPEDVAAVQALRGLLFRNGAPDGDDHDLRCTHLLVEERASGRLVAGCRLLLLRSGAELPESYASQFYDLAPLTRYPRPILEIGRFCIAPAAAPDPDTLRLAWGALAGLVDREGVGLLIGCTSFPGADPAPFTDALTLLKARHLAPRAWRPRVKAPLVYRFARLLRARQPDLGRALRELPPLLRSYLSLGGCVSDHAVLDHDLDTLHVFTALDVAALPPARARALRAIAC